MITLDTKISGFDARSWHRLITLVAPGLASRAPHEHSGSSNEVAGILLVLYSGDRVVKAWHSRRGIVAVSKWPGVAHASSVAERARAQTLFAIEATALDELFERFGSRLRIDDDPWTTTVVALDAVRELVDSGRAVLWPQLVPQRVPLPAPVVLARAFDVLLPDGKCALVVLFDDHTIDTAVVARRRGPGIDLVLGPERIRDLVGTLGGDYRRDHRHVRQCIENAVGPMALGLFAETRTIHELLRATEPAAWAIAMASREVVFDPMPAWLAFAAGAGVMRAASSGSTSLLRRTRVFRALAPTIETARSLVERVRGGELRQLFGGAGPLQILAGVLRRSAPEDSPEHDSLAP